MQMQRVSDAAGQYGRAQVLPDRRFCDICSVSVGDFSLLLFPVVMADPPAVRIRKACLISWSLNHFIVHTT